MSGTLTVRSGFESVQGRRWNMEDTHVIIDDVSKILPTNRETLHHNTFAFYAIFDGHGGKQCAILAEKELHQNILKNPDFLSGNDIEGAIIKAFKETDDYIGKMAQQEGWNNGSTAVVVIIIDDTLWIANIGDSEAILARKKDKSTVPVVLSKIHKPTKEDEKKRLEDLGVPVSSGRVAGSLAVSRAFGDFDFKSPANGGQEDWVLCEPYVNKLQILDTDEFLILACDGLWDKLSYQDAVDIASKAKKSHKSPIETSDLLVRESLDRGTLDNVTVIVVFLTHSSAR